jgi:hypothetical protein
MTETSTARPKTGGAGHPQTSTKENPVATTVINLKGRIREYGPRLEHATKNLIYVGRRMTPRGPGTWDLPQHPLRNPHLVGNPCRARGCHGIVHTREEAVSEYCRRLLAHPELLALVPALRGRVLGCWCAPELCHGHVLSVLAEVPELELRRVLQELAADPLAALPAAV